MRAREEDSSPSPVERAPAAQPMPLYHEALQEEADQERSRRAVRLGLPVAERPERNPSVSTIGSELERFAGGGGNGGNTPARQGVLHSTRASSGVFPDDGDDDEEEEAGEDEGKDDRGDKGSKGSGSKKSSKKSSAEIIPEASGEE